jgi:hypothetical protein
MGLQHRERYSALEGLEGMHVLQGSGWTAGGGSQMFADFRFCFSMCVRIALTFKWCPNVSTYDNSLASIANGKGRKILG